MDPLDISSDWVILPLSDLCTRWVTSAHINYEIGGFVQLKKDFKTVRFVQTGVEKINRNGRSFVVLPIMISSCLFHTHDYTKPFWPSQEDLLFGIPTRTGPFRIYTNILFTKHGVWIYNGTSQSRIDSEYSIDTYIRNIYELQNEMNGLLWSLPHNWNIQMVVGVIDDFINKCVIMGYDIRFIDYDNFTPCTKPIDQMIYDTIQREIIERITI